MARYWYAFNGSGNDLIPGNYTRATLPPDQFCEGGSVSCAILLPDTGRAPIEISQNIKDYLIIAKATRTYYPTIGKPYVYMRPFQ